MAQRQALSRKRKRRAVLGTECDQPTLSLSIRKLRLRTQPPLLSDDRVKDLFAEGLKIGWKMLLSCREFQNNQRMRPRGYRPGKVRRSRSLKKFADSCAKFSARCNSHFWKDAMKMVSNRAMRKVELCRDFLVRKTCRSQLSDPQFLWT